MSAEPAACEADLYGPLMLEATRLGGRLFRNNVGLARYRGRAGVQQVRYGLAPGSSDLIGWTPDGRFWAVEAKRPGWRQTPSWLQSDQNKFLLAVCLAGGVGVVVTSIEELAASLNGSNL